MDSATAFNTLDELQADLQQGMKDAKGNPTGEQSEADKLFASIKEEVGHHDPAVVAYAALTLAKWAIDRIQP